MSSFFPASPQRALVYLLAIEQIAMPLNCLLLTMVAGWTDGWREQSKEIGLCAVLLHFISFSALVVSLPAVGLIETYLNSFRYCAGPLECWGFVYKYLTIAGAGLTVIALIFAYAWRRKYNAAGQVETCRRCFVVRPQKTGCSRTLSGLLFGVKQMKIFFCWNFFCHLHRGYLCRCSIVLCICVLVLLEFIMVVASW